jgi:hypothetical protein
LLHDVVANFSQDVGVDREDISTQGRTDGGADENNEEGGRSKRALLRPDETP